MEIKKAYTPVIKEGGYFLYANGRYCDFEGKLKERVGQKVRVIQGWNPGELVVVNLSRGFICHAYQTNLDDPDLEEKKELALYELALSCLYRVVSGKESLDCLLVALKAREARVIKPMVEEMLDLPNGTGEWKQTRDRVWWNIYREDERWELLRVVRRKRMEKYSVFTFHYKDGVKREFVGRFLSLGKAQFMAAKNAHRRSRWISPPRPENEYQPKKVEKRKNNL